MEIKSIKVIAEPMGNGYQAHINDNPCFWGRGDSIYEAVGSAVSNHVQVNLEPSAQKLLAKHQNESLNRVLNK